MRYFGRQEKYLAFADRHVRDATFLDQPQHDVTFELVEEFLTRVVMEILPGIRSAHRHDNEFGVLE